MNLTRPELIQLLEHLAMEIRRNNGGGWKVATATGDVAYSVKLEITGLILKPADRPVPAPATLFDEKYAGDDDTAPRSGTTPAH